MMAASSSLGDTLRDFAFEFSADFDDKNTAVIDHFAFDTKLDSKGKHTVVYSDSANLARNSVILSDAVLNGPPILFKGIGHKLTGRNQLAMKVLGTGPSAYSYDVEDEEISAAPMINGAEMALVSVLQARNNARIAFCGSLEMFSDLYVPVLPLPYRRRPRRFSLHPLPLHCRPWPFTRHYLPLCRRHLPCRSPSPFILHPPHTSAQKDPYLISFFTL